MLDEETYEVASNDGSAGEAAGAPHAEDASAERGGGGDRLEPAPRDVVARCVSELEARRRSAGGARPGELDRRRHRDIVEQLLDSVRDGDLRSWEHFAARSAPEAIDRLSPEIARLALTCLVAQVRAAQQRVQQRGRALPALTAAFRALANARARHAAGIFIHGMARSHGPKGSDWEDDARRAERRLRELLGFRSDPPPASTGVRPPRPRARAATSRGPARERRDDAPDAAWPHWPLVRGRHAVMVGGAIDEASRAAIQRGFGLAELREMDPGKLRSVQSQVERIEAGSVDLVLVSKYCGHEASIPIRSACRRAGVPFYVLRRGYGVQAVRRAIERVRGDGSAASPLASSRGVGVGRATGVPVAP